MNSAVWDQLRQSAAGSERRVKCRAGYETVDNVEVTRKKIRRMSIQDDEEGERDRNNGVQPNVVCHGDRAVRVLEFKERHAEY